MDLPELVVEGIVFPPVVRPPDSAASHFLAGAGVQGLEIGGKPIKVSALGVYLEDAAVSVLAKKWAGKTADELESDADFLRDIVAGDEFVTFMSVNILIPLTGAQYADKWTVQSIDYLKAKGEYTVTEVVAVDKFKEVFQPEMLLPGSSVLLTHSKAGVLTVAFSKDSLVPAAGVVAIENKPLSEALLETLIGEHGVSPAAKQSLAARVSELLTKGAAAATADEVTV